MVFVQRWSTGLCLIGGILLSPTTASGQTTAHGTVVQDTFVMLPYPDNVNGLSDHFFAGNSGWRYDGWVQFDLPEAPEGLSLQSATLQLYNFQVDWVNRGGEATIAAKAIPFAWSEGNATWASASANGGDEPPPYGDTVYDTQVFVGDENATPDRIDAFPNEWRSWDVTQLARDWYDGTMENNGIVLLGGIFLDPQIDGTGLFAQFYSKEFLGDGGDHPDPLPPTLELIFDEGGNILLGDVNLDGVVNGLDVDPFVGLVTSGEYQVEADMNEDDAVNGLDVDPFVAAVVGGGAAAVPEPSTCVLLLLGLALIGLRKRRQSLC